MKFKLKWFDATEDEDIKRKRDIAKLACAKRILLEFQDDRGIDDYLVQMGLLDETCDSIQRKTLVALAFVRDKIGDREATYNTIIGEISKELRKKIPLGAGGVNTDLSKYFLGKTGLKDLQLDIPDKKDSCIQCGISANSPLEKVFSFGFKPTDGGGKKVTKLTYNEKYNGRICELCKLENEQRKREFEELESGISLQIHLGDAISPVNVKQVIDSIKEDTRKDIDIDKDLKIHLSKKEKMQLDYHSLGFIHRPVDIKDEFLLLRKQLRIIKGTGFKINVSPLFSAGRILKPMFTWENSPGWIKTLGWNSLRIDQIDPTLREVELVFTVAKLGRGIDDIPDVVRSLSRNPAGFLRKLWVYYVRKKSPHYWLANQEGEFRFFLERHKESVNLTKMDEIVEAACRIDRRAPESNNEHTWMMREALEAYERTKNSPNVQTDDIERTIAGRLWEIAKRDRENSSRASQEGSVLFSKALVGLIRERFAGDMPRSEMKRDLVAQFALMYNLAKWKQVETKKKSGSV
ncbi:MAG: hypothetical protein ACYDAZ_06535 [Thermoplasmataceae archaeon]